MNDLHLKARRAAIFVVAGLAWSVPVIACGRRAVSGAVVDPGVAVAVILAGVYAPPFAAWRQAEAGFFTSFLVWCACPAYFVTRLLGEDQVGAGMLVAIVYWALVPALGAFACAQRKAAH